jgi:hypothetical protein
VAKVAIHFVATLPTPGIYNVCNPGQKSTKEIADMLDLDKSWFTEEEFKQATTAPRSNCVMNTDKLQSVYPIQSIDDALRTAIENLKTHDV